MSMLRGFSQERIAFTLAVILFVVFAVSLDGFLTPRNILSLLRSVAVLRVLGLAMAIVVIGRGGAHRQCVRARGARLSICAGGPSRPRPGWS
jgi:hypothetical protein